MQHGFKVFEQSGDVNENAICVYQGSDLELKE
jgi:hypothetical protein